jgi:hypothetical protein
MAYSTILYQNEIRMGQTSMITYIASAFELEELALGGVALFGLVELPNASCKLPVALYALRTAYR